MFSSSRRLVAAALCGMCAGAVLSACGSDSGTSAPGPGRGEKLTVTTAFYPLQYAAQRIAGDTATVTNLTKPGGEPHDLELTPRDVGQVEQSDLVVYLKGFQPAVDDVVAQEAADHNLEVSRFANLTLTVRPGAEDAQHEHAHEDDPADEAGHDAAEEGARDPHFWLDPQRLSKVGDGIAARLSELAPDQAATFRDNAAKFRSDLAALDSDFRAGLATCQNRDLVTSHEAFGYLSARYGFQQVGITGLSPEQEPSPAQLRQATTFVRDHDVHTIYYETLVSPAVANTVARETGAKSAVLDPVEGLTDQSAGRSYTEVMRANLETLRKGQACT